MSVKAVIYARKSVSDRNGDESGSITEQLESGRHHAAAQGWQVVGEFVDDGVSATHAPEDRDGWRALLSATGYDRVIVRHIDRVSRRLIDYLTAHRTLEARGAGLVSIRQHIDMSSPNGRLFANILASFSEYERELIRERVALTRTHNLKAGRVVGGTVPWGWRAVNTPGGRGKVLAQDPERTDLVREVVGRTLAGHTVYATAGWLTDQGVPTPTWEGVPFAVRPWRYSTVERLLRHPLLAGMVPFNPGRTGTRTRGEDVLRDEHGLPVVHADLAVMEVAEWRRMVQALDDRQSPQARPRDQRATTSSLLSGLLLCGDPGHDEPVRMWRGTIQGRESYSCPKCSQTISNFEDVVVEHFLAQKGEHLRWRRVEVVHEGGAALLPEIERRLDELDRLIRDAPTREARAELQAQQGSLLDLRDQKRDEAPMVDFRWEGTDQSFQEDWEAAVMVAERRAILDDGLGSITVTRGRPGRRTTAQVLARLSFAWKGEVGPLPVPDESWVA